MGPQLAVWLGASLGEARESEWVCWVLDRH